MKKIFKKILTSLCSLTLCVICLSGCSWLEIDKEKYYNQIVVTVGEKEFTKKDLVDAFSSYGYQYYQSYGYTMEQSINETIKSMIDRELLLDEVKKTITLSDQEKLEVKKEVFDYMQDSINTYETKIRKEWDMEIKYEEHIHEEGDDHSHEEESLRTAEENYTPTTEFANGVVTRIEETKEKVLTDGLPEHFTKDYQIVTDPKVSNEAWTRYIKSLQDLAKSEGRSTVESDVLLAEENRLTELLTNNKLLEKYEEAFFDRTPVDTASVLAYFKEQYKSQMGTYNTNPSAYHTAMKESSKNMIYYHYNSGNEYVNVKHILMNFTQEQKDAITSLNTLYGITEDNTEEDELKKQDANYQARLQEIVNRTTTTFEMSEELYREYGSRYNFARVAGKENTYTAYASDVYKFVQDYVSGTTLKQRSSKFDDLVYVFNDDTGFMNSEFDYVVNLDTSVEDQMVKPFANGVRALDTSNGGEGAGSMDMIVSTYGLHIIFHDGVAENIVDEYNIDSISDEQLLAILCTKTTTPDSNKTIFNYIYDKLALDENLYNNMTQEVVKNARTNLKENNIIITYYESHYKDLWE